jgi:hypothetical protein
MDQCEFRASAVARRSEQSLAHSAICAFSKIKIPHISHTHSQVSWTLQAYLTGVHLVGVHLMSVYLTGMHLIDAYLINVHLMGMHLTGVHLIYESSLRVEHGWREYLYRHLGWLESF